MSSDIFIQAKQDGQLSSDHLRIGDVLSEQGKRDLEALESYECALIIMKEHYSGDAPKLALLYQWIGVKQSIITSLHTAALEQIPMHHAILCEKLASISISGINGCIRIHRNGRMS